MKSRRISRFVATACVSVMCVSLCGVASCEKMVTDEGGDERANVVLSVSSVGDVPFQAATRSGVLSEICTRLNFLIYDGSGTRIRQVNQTASDANFGQATFYLSKGRYFVTVLAHSSNGNPTSTNPNKITFTNATGFTDTFFYGDSLTVGDEGLSKSLELKRIVAMVRFIPYDTPPTEATGVNFYYTGGSGALDAADGGWGTTQSKQSVDIPTDGRDHFDIYTIPHSGDQDTLRVQVRAYDGASMDAGELLTDKTIEGIPVRRNHITTCRGHLYSPVYPIDFDITIDDVWDTDTLTFNIPN